MKETTTVEHNKKITLTRDELKTLLRLNTKLDGEIDRCYWDAGARTLSVFCLKVEVHKREEDINA